MLAIRRTAAAIAAVVVLGGCSMTDQGPGPGGRSDSRSQTAGAQSSGGSGSNRQEMRATQLAASGAIPSLGTTVFEPQQLPQFETTGTYVGQKVQELRGDLEDLKTQISDHNQRLQELRQRTRSAARGYHGNVGQINTRLQLGTTPGNPELVEMWNQARQRLGTVEQTVDDMNQLSNEVSSTTRLASYLLESVQAAYGLSGAVEKDHDQLAILEDSTNRTVVLIDRLANELSSDIARQNRYLQRERADLSTLSLAIKNGEFYGESLSNQAYGTPTPASSTGSSDRVGRDQPLVVIRFDQDNVDYEQPLYSAVRRVLDRRPEAGFDVVAVAPQGGQQSALGLSRARRQAERVLRALNEMGLPPSRVSLSATTSARANVNEVHVYVR
ncbi:hypothetical protein [Rhodovibrio salinarum]|nr:hypothetical protein [Rhodovibrio salinarum]